jgi:hypothetical protein
MAENTKLRGYRFCLHKAYLDKGMGLTYYVKYLIGLFGISSMNVKATMIIAAVWIFLSYFLGLAWFKYKFVIAEQEVQNKVNLFVQEMRAMSGAKSLNTCSA